MGPATKRELKDGLRQQLLSDEFVLDMICQRAYEIFLSRGQEHGHDREDWLQAETEILDRMMEKQLQGRLELWPAGFRDSEVDQERPGYNPRAAKPEPLPATGASVRPQSDQSWPADIPSVPATRAPLTESSRKKADKSSKVVSGRKDKNKDKKMAEPGYNEATVTAHGNKSKKSGHKSKANNKREKKSAPGQ
jgi:hypothetical protein